MQSLLQTQTPSRSTNVTVLEEEPDVTLTETGTETASRRRFTDIENNVNQALNDLNTIYSQIGYLAPEIAIKKTEIFTVLNETVLNYVGSLQREKNNIENECEWLRQQIRIILAIISDRTGSESLDIMQRGIVFNDKSQFEEGYRQQVLAKMSTIASSRAPKGVFLESSPFNSESLSQIDIVPNGGLAQTDYLLRNVPQLSMLQLKSRLNSIFLECLKLFVVKFKQFTELNLTYAECTEFVGEDIVDNKTSKLLPSRSESEDHRQLIRQFDAMLAKLHMDASKPQSIILLSGKNDDSQAFIISSPRKNLRQRECLQEEVNHNNKDDKHNGLSQLRDLNYQLVTVIRNLKITKISSELLQKMNDDINQYESLILERESRLRDIINKCIDCISMLQLSDEKLIELQKRNEANSQESNMSLSTEYFDLDTLRFIKTNPRQFGLSNAYFTYIESFLQLLEHKRIHKQQKFDYYFDKCKDLWEKLSESPDYVEKFMTANNSLNETCLMNLKMELNRLHLRRAEFVDSFIMESRQQLLDLWDQLFYSEEQRAEFQYYNLNIRDEELDKEKVLKVHEHEYEKLKQEFREKGKILQLYTELQGLVEDRKFLDETSKDPSRLLSKNKNSCRNLLIEERKRKHLTRRMPIVLSTLKSEISTYNNLKHQSGGKYITFEGVDLFEKVLVIESEFSNSATRSSRPKIRSPPKSDTRSPQTRATNSHRSKTLAPIRNTNSSVKKPPIPPRPVPLYSTNHNRLLSNRTPSSGSSTRSASTLAFSKEPSPLKLDASKTSSSISRLASAHLQPLNSPLKMFQTKNSHVQSSIIGVGINTAHDDINADSTHCSTLFGTSPLKLSMNSNIQFNSFSVGNSPTRNRQNFNEGDKENIEISPVKIPTMFTPGQFDSGDSHDIELQSDISTLVGGDEYLLWKDRRIRDLNTQPLYH